MRSFVLTNSQRRVDTFGCPFGRGTGSVFFIHDRIVTVPEAIYSASRSQFTSKPTSSRYVFFPFRRLALLTMATESGSADKHSIETGGSISRNHMPIRKPPSLVKFSKKLYMLKCVSGSAWPGTAGCECMLGSFKIDSRWPHACCFLHHRIKNNNSSRNSG